MTRINSRQQKIAGIALLMTMMVLSVVLAVTLAIVELTLKQLALSVDSRDSEIAFHAANAGLECARYTRRHASTTFESGANSVPINCFNVSSTLKKVALGIATTSNGAIGDIFRYQKSLSWSGNHCSEIDIITMVVSTTSPTTLYMTGPDDRSLAEVFSGYSYSRKGCAPGGVCTIASVAGYNSSCAGNSTSTDGVLKREVLLEF